MCAWRSAGFLRRVAAHLLARADVMDLTERERRSRMKYWSKRLGLDIAPGTASRPFSTASLSRQEMKAS